MTGPGNENPDQSARMAKAWLILTPFGAALAYGLAAVQGADTRSCLIITAAMIGLCLFWALLYYLRGSSAPSDARRINAILRLLIRR